MVYIYIFLLASLQELIQIVTLLDSLVGATVAPEAEQVVH